MAKKKTTAKKTTSKKTAPKKKVPAKKKTAASMKKGMTKGMGTGSCGSCR